MCQAPDDAVLGSVPGGGPVETTKKPTTTKKVTTTKTTTTTEAQTTAVTER